MKKDPPRDMLPMVADAEQFPPGSCIRVPTSLSTFGGDLGVVQANALLWKWPTLGMYEGLRRTQLVDLRSLKVLDSGLASTLRVVA